MIVSVIVLFLGIIFFLGMISIAFIDIVFNEDVWEIDEDIKYK